MVVDKIMLEMWKNISENYWKAKDLEEKQRILLSDFLKNKKWNVLELWCWNWKILNKIKNVNNELNLNWLDYSSDMINQAKKGYDNINFINWNILNVEKIFWNTKFDIVYSVNTLHNLPTKDFIYSTFEKMNFLTKKWWYIVFDIRNQFNPFINYWYFKNRKRGLNFWTLNIFNVLNIFKKFNVEVVLNRGIFYENINDSLFVSKNIFFRFLFKIYLKITSLRIFSQYIFVILRKK